MQTSLATMEERDCMDTLDSVRDSQLSFSADTESESNSSSTCCSSSSSTKTVSLLDRLLHTYFNGSCMRKFQKEKNYYKNNRGSFWELENRIIGRKNICRPHACQHCGSEVDYSEFMASAAG